MALKRFISGFLGMVFIAISALASAETSNSTTLSISVVVPERAEDQRCTVGFENGLDNKFTAMQNSGCRYNSKAILQTAYQQATQYNDQGFVTVIITAP